MTYQQRWLVAVALKQPYPSPFEAGEVAPEATSETTSAPQLTGMVESLRRFQVYFWVGGVAVALGSGLIGYAIGKGRS